MGKSWQETRSRSNRSWPFPAHGQQISESQPRDTCHMKLFSNSGGRFALQGLRPGNFYAQCKWLMPEEAPFLSNVLGLWGKGKIYIHVHWEAVKEANRWRRGRKDTTFISSHCGLRVYLISLKSLNNLKSWVHYLLFQKKTHDLQNLNNWPSHTTGRQNQLLFIWPQGPYLYYNIHCLHRGVAKTSLLSLLT